MHIVAMLHKTGLPMAEVLAPVWREITTRSGGKLIAVANPDCGPDPAWADRTHRWPCDPGHNGLDQCKRHHLCCEIAANLPGVTAITEPDAFPVCAIDDLEPGLMLGSRLWDAKNELGDTTYIARWFLHPPYVANQQDWAATAENLGWWMSNNVCFDRGHNDRVLCLAAQIAGIRLRGDGFSRNTVQLWEAGELRQALEAGGRLVHGVKDPRCIHWWLAREGFMQDPDLWTEMGLEPDTRPMPWAMDLRHIHALRRAVEAQQPRVMVEIGSHRGHSTAGFLRALDRLPDAQLHLIEPAPTPELLALIERSPHKERVTLHTESSWETNIAPDFIFIDGNHEWPALADLAWALAADCPVIAIHDTQTHPRNLAGGCWGASLAADILRQALDRHWLEDAVDRPGEHTGRGLGISVADRADWEAILPAWREAIAAGS